MVPAQLELAVEVALGASVHHLVAETAAGLETSPATVVTARSRAAG